MSAAEAAGGTGGAGLPVVLSSGTAPGGGTGPVGAGADAAGAGTGAEGGGTDVTGAGVTGAGGAGFGACARAGAAGTQTAATSARASSRRRLRPAGAGKCRSTRKLSQDISQIMGRPRVIGNARSEPSVYVTERRASFDETSAEKLQKPSRALDSANRNGHHARKRA